MSVSANPLALRALRKIRRLSTPMVTTPLGFKVEATSPHVARHAEDITRYEPHLIEWAKLIDPDEIAYDVGANFGFAALIALAKQPRSRIFCFETNPYSLDRILRHALLNRVSENIAVLNLGISDRRELLSGGFTKRLDDYAGLGLVLPGEERGDVRPNFVQPVWMITETIDNLVSSGLPSPQHIKIDVDGAEALVLRGARETLPHVRSVCLEWIDSDPRTVEEVDHLASLGFKQVYDRVNGMEAPAHQKAVGRHRDTLFLRR